MTDSTVETTRRTALSNLGLLALAAVGLYMAPSVVGASKARADGDEDEEGHNGD